jgi:Tfp pilus assembly protein PilO
MKHLEEYAEHAQECRAMAAKALLPEIRTYLLEMAERWEEMARQRAVHVHLEELLADLLKNGKHHGNHNGGASAA